jgi:hypothetical protein
MERIVVYDEATGKVVASNTDIGDVGSGGGSGSFIEAEFNFDVGAGGQSVFSVDPTPIAAETEIDVWINGRLMREGASDDYQRDTGNNEIEFNYTVDEDAWVFIRVKNIIEGVAYDTEDFVSGAGGQTDFTLSSIDLVTSSKVDVWVNGRITREGGSNDWTRVTSTDKIIFNYTVDEDAWVRVRVYK